MIKPNFEKRKSLLFHFAGIVISFFIFVVFGEVVLRAFLSHRLKIPTDERNLTYRYDQELGWFPVENSERYFTGSRRIFVKHNTKGFRDHEYDEKRRPRIAFLGDSFVWGYDVEREERFTEKLQELLPDTEVINLGVSGYGTDQEFLLIKKYFSKLKPDIVFLIFSSNDRNDNSGNNKYGGYYKPYFIVDEGKIKLKGLPIKKALNYYYIQYPILFKSYVLRGLFKSYFRLQPHLELQDPTEGVLKEFHHFVVSQGARFVIGFQCEDEDLKRFCKKNEILYFDLKNPFTYPSHGGHWTPEGHTYVSQRICDFLKENNM